MTDRGTTVVRPADLRGLARGITGGLDSGEYVRRLRDDEPCDHTDAYGSMVMEGGPMSRYPGEPMCIGCDERAPFLRVVR